MNGGEITNRIANTFVRIVGATIAAASVFGAAYVIAKLYTGRGANTPMRSALHEQPLVALLGLTGFAFGVFAVLYPENLIAARRWLNPAWVWRERKGEALLLAVSGLLSLAVLEVGSRAMYARDERLPFRYRAEYLVYPELYHALNDYTPETRNVLLLGGSVLNGAGRGGRMQATLGPGWRVYNVAMQAHSSLDSLTKYRYLLDHGYRFDYVIFYHGINETRANNAPPDVFRPDYSHYTFYRLVHSAFGDWGPVRHAALQSALVFRVNRLVGQLLETRSLGRRYIQFEYPRADWLRYGADIKSAASFESNLLEIARLANQHGAMLIVGEFADNPLLNALARQPGNAALRDEMTRATKLWGLPDNVRAGMIAHNEVIRHHADRYATASTSMFSSPADFVDACHFTPDAEVRFIEFWAGILRSADAQRARGD